MQIKYYYINLDRSPERRAYMERQFDLMNINPVRVPAVDGYKLSVKECQEISNKQTLLTHFMKPKLGEIGAFLSYKLTWKMIAEQSEDFAVVIEDDIAIKPELLEDLSIILEKISPDEIVDISGRQGFIKMESRTASNDVELIRFSTPPLGTTGKIFGREAATFIYNSFTDYLAPHDVMLQKIYKHKIPIWSVNKHYLSHVDQEVGGTTLQMSDISLKGKVWREFKRPFWRLAIKIGNLLRT